MWDVIIWATENAIDFVPSSWASEDRSLYKYPSEMSQQKLRQVIYESQNIEANYKWYPAEVKVKDVKVLKRAQQLCEMGQYTSNIENTSDSDEEMNKRKNRRMVLCENGMVHLINCVSLYVLKCFR